MAETAGENLVFIILFVIFIFVIVLVFAYFLLFGFGFTNSTTCYGSSQVTNFFYQDLCISKFFCIATTLNSIGIGPPLIGCSPSVQTYASSSNTGQVFSGITSALGDCWYQYGANSGLDVLYNGPGLCSVVGVSLNNQKNLTFYNLTQYLKAAAFSKQISCLNHTAAQSCGNYQEGFTCDTNTPTECQAYVNSYFQCQSQQDYSPIQAGYVLQSIFLNDSTKHGITAATTAANNFSAALCDPSQGCSFNQATLSCTNSSGKVGSCTQVFDDFCANTTLGYDNCTFQYDSNTGDYQPPEGCTLTEAVNSNSTINVSYFNYLEPGVNLIYNWKNKTSGQTVAVSPYSNMSINHAELYIVYLNSFANSALPPNGITMPTECVPQGWVNNYPTSGIEYSCGEALAVYGSAALSGPGLITLGVAGASGYLYGACRSNTLCNEYVDADAAKAVSTTLYTTSGLQGCMTSIEDELEQSSVIDYFRNGIGDLVGFSSVNPPNFLGRNQIYICAVTD